jgi:YidC/Oxa1 family membrane protein insertase
VDKPRIALAFFLILVVAVLPGLLMKPKPLPRRPADRDSAAVHAAGDTARAVAPTPAPTATGPAVVALPAETVWVTSDLYRYGFTTSGARLVAAELEHYRSFAPGDSGQRAQIVPAGHPLLGGQLVVGSDTLALADLSFTPDAKALRVTAGKPATLHFVAQRGRDASITLAYTFSPDDYHIGVAGQVRGIGSAGGGAVLVLELGSGLRSVDADVMADYREYALVTKTDRTQKKAFTSLDPGQTVALAGPFEWVGIKSKYFFAAVLAARQNETPFVGVLATGMPRDSMAVSSLFGTKLTTVATRARVATTLVVPPSGGFQYDAYVGPFEHRRLVNLGHGLDDANPYGWSVFRPIIHPVSLFVVQVLFWMHERLHLQYGWVLIIFGIVVRLALWPLNQRAMESQMRMQAVQPLMQEIQTRYKNDPQKLQEQMLKLYKEHKINPFGGCFPMLLPMPVLLALFFVFTNSIEFRGVPFLWLPDLARHDPLFIMPILMGLSMFVVSKLGQRGMPPNPQTKTMLYVFPAMFTFLFLRFSSGLNLYYFVQNLVSIPQQYRIAQQRLRRQGKP